MGLALILPLLLYIVYLIREIRVSLGTSEDVQDGAARVFGSSIVKIIHIILESFGKEVENKTLDTLSTAQRSKTQKTKSRNYKISVACRFTWRNLKVWLEHSYEKYGTSAKSNLNH